MAAFPAGLRGRFRPLSVLGEGASGTVFLCEEREAAGRLVAVKHMPGYRQPTAEWEATQGFVHPHVARLWARGFAGDGTFIVAEPCSHPRLDEGPPVSDRVAIETIALPLCEALAALHEAGLLHNGVRPRNVRLGPQGPVLVDFGPGALVRSAPPCEPDVPCTLPPERLVGGPWDGSADVYGLAATIYFAVAGRSHVEGRRRDRWLDALAHPMPLRDAAPACEPAIAAAIDGALAADRARRPATARALSATLRHALAVQAAPRPRAPQPAAADRPRGPTLMEALAELEERLVRQALDACAGNQSRAARNLGITRRGLQLKMRRFAIAPARGRGRPRRADATIA